MQVQILSERLYGSEGKMDTSASLSRWSSGFNTRQSRFTPITQLVENMSDIHVAPGSSPGWSICWCIIIGYYV